MWEVPNFSRYTGVGISLPGTISLGYNWNWKLTFIGNILFPNVIGIFTQPTSWMIDSINCNVVMTTMEMMVMLLMMMMMMVMMIIMMLMMMMIMRIMTATTTTNMTKIKIKKNYFL